MQILNINSRQTNHQDVAFLFDTGSQICEAWSWILKNRRLEFSYRPDSEGHDEDRAMLAAHLEDLKNGATPGLSADTIHRLLAGHKIFQAELSYDIRPVLT